MKSPHHYLRRIYYSIFTRVILIGLALVAFGTLSRLFVFAQFLLPDIDQYVLTRQHDLAGQVAQQLGQEIELRQAMLQQLAATLPTELLNRPEALRAWLRERHTLLSPVFDGLIVEAPNGHLISDYPQHLNWTTFNSATSTYADHARTEQPHKLGESEIGHLDNEPALSMAVPLNSNGQTHAVLRSLNTFVQLGLPRLLKNYRSEKSGGYLVVFSQEHVYVDSTDSALILKRMPPLGTMSLADQAITSIQTADARAVAPKSAEISATALVPNVNWTVIAHLPISEAHEIADHARKRILDYVQLIIPCFVILAGVGLYFTLRPLSRAAAHADRMSRGEIPLEPLPSGNDDEVGHLTAAFNRLLSNLTEQKKQLTEQKEIAELATLTKSRFIAAASHDLRQPMHALNLYLGTLTTHDFPERERAAMENIRFCVQTMDEMFRALLDLSQLDANMVRANIQIVPMAPLLEKIQREFQLQAQAKGLELKVVSSSAWVSTDPALLERILRNFVSNAVRYTERGKILVGCRRIKNGLRLAVYDTGPGIASEQQIVVFEEFFQVNNPKSDSRQGMGLGLAIVQRLASLLSAPLALKSGLGSGSIFSIDLPRVSEAAKSLARPISVKISSDTSQGNPLAGVLVVFIDDEAIIIDAMRLLLERWGCTAVLAFCAEEAIKQLSHFSRAPDAIMCDYRLQGGETGLEVITALRNEFNADIPALLITGDTAPERVVAILESGIPVLHKPLQEHELKDALLRLLHQNAAS